MSSQGYNAQSNMSSSPAPSTQQPANPTAAKLETARFLRLKRSDSSRRKAAKRNSARRKTSQGSTGSIDNSPESTPWNSKVSSSNVPDSPRGRVPFCRICNFRAAEKKEKGNFLKNVFRKTIAALRASDTQNKPRGDLISDSLPEYSGKPGSIDMLPIPRFPPPFPGFEQEIAKNPCPVNGVFEEKRPWWSLNRENEREALVPYQPISKLALDLCYEKDPSVFQRPIGRKTFYDPVTEDIETLKAVDAIHNCENRVLSNTFFSGIYVQNTRLTDRRKMASKESNSDEPKPKNKKEKKEAPVVHVKFAEEPYFLHQYSRKDRNLTGETNFRRRFIHAEYNLNRKASKVTVPAVVKKKGLVCD